MRPSRDPECQRYIDDPAYSWYSGRWRTEQGIETKIAADKRYRQSEKGRAKKAIHNRSDKGRAAYARYENSSIRTSVAGFQFRYRVPPEKKEEILTKLNEFRAEQTRTRQEARENGWIN